MSDINKQLELELRKKVRESGVRLIESKLVQGTWGNISIRLDDTYMIVTPSGLDYKRLTPEDMVLFNYHTGEYVGLKPTSEKKIHAAIYRTRPDINAVIHSHPSYCCSVAAAGVTLPVMSDEMQKLVGGDARVSGYALPSTNKMTVNTIAALEGRKACLLANHGVIACANDIDEAFEVCKVMEESSKVFVEQQTMKKSGKSEFSLDSLFEVFKKSC